jgi:hypothetical protein
MPITHKRLSLFVWLLENVNREVSILEASRSARVLEYSPTSNAFKDLTAAGYLRKTSSGRYQVSNATALVHQIALANPFHTKRTLSFFVGGTMIEKMRKLNSLEPNSTFTLFAGAELLSPYVQTSKVHAYVPDTASESLQVELTEDGARRAEENEADTFLLPTGDDTLFRFSRKKGEFRIAPMGILIADLESYGGLGQEQAIRIMNDWLSGNIQ